jgi:hypothetical protein
MDYIYDVFISYKRQRTKSEWLIEHFLPLFRDHLEEEIAEACGRRLRRIFFDQAEIATELRQLVEGVNGIEPGEDWRDALREAIRGSACMVGLWSPLYFLSEWCCIEWKSFEGRSRQGNARTIIPISVHPSTKNRPEARDYQLVDLSEYVILGRGFKDNERYVHFQDALRLLARTVAAAVKLAPPFTTWPIATAVPAPAEPIPVPTFGQASAAK